MIHTQLPDDVARLPLARGSFDDLEIREGNLSAYGWMMLKDSGFDSIRIYINGEPVREDPIQVRDDVGAHFHWLPFSARSGFQITVSPAEVGKPLPETGRLDLVGCVGGEPVARMGSLYRAGLYDSAPTPPSHLMKRVAHTENVPHFKITGLKNYGEFVEAIHRHADIGQMEDMLDWGCGCGRVAFHFENLPDGPAVKGCDVDPEATAWATANLRQGPYEAIPLMPPTHYADGQFDLIVSCSVFTHLTRDVQKAWLREMRRLLKPGGLFVASVHGDFATSFLPGVQENWLKDMGGIHDATQDPTIDAIAPSGYYRATYQTREYTEREFSKYFDVLEYIERGIINFHDLVVMRRPDTPLSADAEAEADAALNPVDAPAVPAPQPAPGHTNTKARLTSWLAPGSRKRKAVFAAAGIGALLTAVGGILALVRRQRRKDGNEGTEA